MPVNRRLNVPRHSLAAPHRRKGHADFDPGSGQVYFETTVSVQRDSSAWKYRPPNPTARLPGTKGPPRLKDIAMATLLENLASMSSLHLEGVSWTVGQQIWSNIVSRRMKTLHAWQTFATTYPEEFQRRKNRYRMIISDPALPLIEYFRGLTSPSLSWIVFASVSSTLLQMTDLIDLSTLQNLVGLDVAVDDHSAAQTSSFDVRIVRTWSEIAGMSGAFRHLRILMLRGQHDVSAAIFQYLSPFPSLDVVIIQNHFSASNYFLWEKEALQYGWVVDRRGTTQSPQSERVSDPDKPSNLLPQKECLMEDYDILLRLKSQTLDVLRELYCGFSPPMVRDSKSELGGCENLPPFVECRIGEPKPWRRPQYPDSSQTQMSFGASVDTVIFRRCRSSRTEVKETMAAPNPRLDGKKRREADSGVTTGRRLPKRPAMRSTSKSVEGLLAEFQG